jgi:hypothetical protein
VTTQIDAYLDELEAALTVSARRRRVILAETRDHLREASTREAATGVASAEAEAAALSAFGPAKAIATAFAPQPTAMRLGTTVGLHVLLLGAAALLTVGVSGAAAGLLGITLGPDIISGDAPAGLDGAACARLAASEPGASNCADAWSWHHLEESVLYRGVPGALGLLLGLATFWIARQHLPRTAWSRQISQRSALLAAFGFTVLCALTSAGAIGLEPDGLPRGATQAGGWWLSWVLGSAAAAIASVAAYAASRRGLTLAG